MFHILPNNSNFTQRKAEGTRGNHFHLNKDSFARGFLIYHFLLSDYKGEIELDLEICLILIYNLMSNCNRCHMTSQTYQLVVPILTLLKATHKLFIRGQKKRLQILKKMHFCLKDSPAGN